MEAESGLRNVVLTKKKTRRWRIPKSQQADTSGIRTLMGNLNIFNFSSVRLPAQLVTYPGSKSGWTLVKTAAQGDIYRPISQGRALFLIP
jgi:hypothetical protein